MCLLQSHTRPRQIRHLATSRPQCLQVLKESYEPMNDDETRELDLEDLKKKKAAKKNPQEAMMEQAPAMKVQGPFPDGILDRINQAKEAIRNRSPPSQDAAPTINTTVDEGVKRRRELEGDDGTHVRHDTAATITDITKFETPAIVFLHLFSGCRRPGDIQTQVEWMHTEGDVCIFVLSLDLAIDPVRGDLRREETVNFWKDQIGRGRAKGGMGGPPCESWTVARRNQDEGGRLPQPLRSRDSPWGLDGVSTKEHEQVIVANELMLTSLTIAANFLKAGGSFVLEHPETAPWPRSVHRFGGSKSFRPLRSPRRLTSCPLTSANSGKYTQKARPSYWSV